MVERDQGAVLQPPLIEPSPAPPAPSERDGLTRRRFLQAAIAAGALAGSGYGIAQLTGSSAPAPRFRSRPDLEPPPTTVVVPADGTAQGLVILAATRTSSYQHGPLIIDNGGHVVWFSPLTSGSANLQVQSYEGRPVLSWWEGEVTPLGYGVGEYVIAGSDYKEITRVRAGNGLQGDLHEFVITPQGTALFTAYHEQQHSLWSVGGSPNGPLLNSLIQEVDIRTGKLLFEWSAVDHVPITDSYMPLPDSASTPWDFFHVNSIDVDTDGNLVLSARHTWAVYKIHRTTGKVIWTLNGKHSDFAINHRAKFAFQHHARRHPDGILTLFDDGAGTSTVEKQSRGLKLRLNEQTMRAHFVEEYLADPSLLATSQGSMQLLPNGNAFIGWGSQPYFSEFGHRARVRFAGQIEAPSNSYRAFRSHWVGRPTDAPAIALERMGHHLVTVYASWNGATQVVSWDVLAGSSADTLKTTGSFARDGFETVMQTQAAGGWIAVQGRDAAGKVLGRSRAVRA
jgi:hypothetical protein